ncbi:MAG: hypothetical protein AAFY57_09230, partial [Cyanobacteria bacterium J06642_2]
ECPYGLEAIAVRIDHHHANRLATVDGSVSRYADRRDRLSSSKHEGMGTALRLLSQTQRAIIASLLA